MKSNITNIRFLIQNPRIQEHIRQGLDESFWQVSQDASVEPITKSKVQSMIHDCTLDMVMGSTDASFGQMIHFDTQGLIFHQYHNGSES